MTKVIGKKLNKETEPIGHSLTTIALASTPSLPILSESNPPVIRTTPQDKKTIVRAIVLKKIDQKEIIENEQSNETKITTKEIKNIEPDNLPITKDNEAVVEEVSSHVIEEIIATSKKKPSILQRVVNKIKPKKTNPTNENENYVSQNTNEPKNTLKSLLKKQKV